MAKQTIQTIGGEQRQVKKSVPVYVWIGVAVAVALITAFILVKVYQPQLLWSNDQRAEHDIDQLVLALNGFAKENGRYPKGTQAEIASLLRGENINGQNPKRLDYIEAKASELNPAGEFIDPWGVPYHIACDGGPRIYSNGPNRTDEYGGGDDIISWREKE
jgi:hypothetical protein